MYLRTLRLCCFIPQAMIAPDPLKRPTAAELVTHPMVCPVTEKSKVCILLSNVPVV